MDKFCPFDAFKELLDTKSYQYHIENSTSDEPILISNTCGHTIIVYNNTLIVNDVSIRNSSRVGLAKSTFFSSVIEDVNFKQVAQILFCIVQHFNKHQQTTLYETIGQHVKILYDIQSRF